MRHKMVVGLFLVDESDAEDLAKSLKEWFIEHNIGMPWHNINITSSDLNFIPWDKKND
jgi:hypothetical protein